MVSDIYIYIYIYMLIEKLKYKFVKKSKYLFFVAAIQNMREN